MKKKKKIEQVITNIFCTSNNTIITITNNRGDCLFWGTPTSYGLKTNKKTLKYTTYRLSEKLYEKLIQQNIKEISINIKGIGKGKKAAILGIKKSGIKINQIIDKTEIPYNGCRPKKKRRI